MQILDRNKDNGLIVVKTQSGDYFYGPAPKVGATTLDILVTFKSAPSLFDARKAIGRVAV